VTRCEAGQPYLYHLGEISSDHVQDKNNQSREKTIKVVFSFRFVHNEKGYYPLVLLRRTGAAPSDFGSCSVQEAKLDRRSSEHSSAA